MLKLTATVSWFVCSWHSISCPDEEMSNLCGVKGQQNCGDHIADVNMFPKCWLIFPCMQHCGRHKKYFWKSSETFLVSAWHATKLPCLCQLDGQHHSTQCCHHNVSSFCWSLYDPEASFRFGVRMALSGGWPVSLCNSFQDHVVWQLWPWLFPLSVWPHLIGLLHTAPSYGWDLVDMARGLSYVHSYNSYCAHSK